MRRINRERSTMYKELRVPQWMIYYSYAQLDECDKSYMKKVRRARLTNETMQHPTFVSLWMPQGVELISKL